MQRSIPFIKSNPRVGYRNGVNGSIGLNAHSRRALRVSYAVREIENVANFMEASLFKSWIVNSGAIRKDNAESAMRMQ